MTSPPEYLIIGHVTFDLTSDGIFLGGAGFYSSLTLSKMGQRVALLTSGVTSEFKQHLDQLEAVVNVPSRVTTTFENWHSCGTRMQKIHSLASVIRKQDVPTTWRKIPTVLLSPVANEIDPSIVDLFVNSSIAISPQGWMRKWGNDGMIRQSKWDTKPSFLYNTQVVVFSHMDIPPHSVGYSDNLSCSVLIITQGSDGAHLRWGNNWFHIPSYPAIQVDPTGCGDVFIAAYLVRYNETKHPLQSALFASCAGSLCAEGSGHISIPNRSDVINRMKQFPKLTVKPVPRPN